MVHAGKFALAAVALAMSVACSSPEATTNTTNHVANAMSDDGQTIKMGDLNDSKQEGKAVLKDTPGGLQVTITVEDEPKGASEPAHIHAGTCEKLNPAPWKPLSNIVGGNSVTTLKGVTLAMIKKGQYAINGHESAKNLKKYVTCGDL